ncbi:cysteine proteinase, partial [Hyaloscypha hepaticicola]
MVLRKKDITTLDDGTWLNDEVINFCVNCLIRTAKHRIHAFNSHFFASLTGAAGISFKYEKVQRWTRKIDILDFDYLVIPIHQAPNHWSVADVKPLIITMDNRDARGRMNRYIFSALSQYIAAEVRSKQGIQVGTTDILWKHSRRVPAPEKQNNYDCGVFALLNLE